MTSVVKSEIGRLVALCQTYFPGGFAVSPAHLRVTLCAAVAIFRLWTLAAMRAHATARGIPVVEVEPALQGRGSRVPLRYTGQGGALDAGWPSCGRRTPGAGARGRRARGLSLVLELDRKVLRPAEEHHPLPLDEIGTVAGAGRQEVEGGLDHPPQLRLRQMDSEAVVRAVPEDHELAGVALEVEAVGIRKDARVAVGAGEGQQQQLALPDLLAVQLEVAHGIARQPEARAEEVAQDLGHRIGHQ